MLDSVEPQGGLPVALTRPSMTPEASLEAYSRTVIDKNRSTATVTADARGVSPAAHSSRRQSTRLLHPDDGSAGRRVVRPAPRRHRPNESTGDRSRFLKLREH